ncbi:MAG: glycoside hydrolase family 65 protein [Lentisphaerae bacterium]|nr:glycoside hydrolase family 65 protein [Lentisphaerota bacterium]
MLGNGYMGVRGTLEEHGKVQRAGCLLNGVYDQVPGKWREPVNAPHGLFTTLEGAGQIVAHEQTLDLRRGRMARRTRYENVSVSSERFVSLDDVHLMCMRYHAAPKPGAGVRVRTGIDTELWEINGPHFKSLERDRREGVESVVGVTGELGIVVAVCAAVEPLDAHGFAKYVAVYTSLDGVDPLPAARAKCLEAKASGYDALGRAHDACWDAVWRRCDVEIEGDDEAQFALRYSLYQLQLAAPRHSDRVSIPARGLSGQVYKGAVFWDTELFMLPVFTLTDPRVARNLIMYRCHTLEGARAKAAEYGYRGAFFAWESQERGNDACTHFNVTDVFTGRPIRTYFRDKQIHISADIVYAIGAYYEQTGDFSVLIDGAAEVVAECARFFYSYAYYKKDKQRYELLDVTGPDEYHERVHNNAFTNRMVKAALDIACVILDRLEREAPDAHAALDRKIGFRAELDAWREMAQRLYVPPPDADGIIPQCDGYRALEDVSLEELKGRMLNPTEYLGGGNGLATTTQILKQADVVLMLHLFFSDYPQETIRKNWEYYEPRCEHGSSLSACAYALVAARLGDTDWAYRYFMQTATVDLTGASTQYIGDLYIGGTHPAANGGAWMSVVFGFAGLRTGTEGLTVTPRLPAHWQRVRFRIEYRGTPYRIDIDSDAAVVIEAKRKKKSGQPV